MTIQLINSISRVTLLSAMILVTLAASAHGQSLADRVRINIPFDFTVGEKKLPAGEYLVGRAQRSDDIAISITARDGGSQAIRLTNATSRLNPKDKASLIFHRYGDQYFLFQVWPAILREPFESFDCLSFEANVLPDSILCPRFHTRRRREQPPGQESGCAAST